MTLVRRRGGWWAAMGALAMVSCARPVGIEGEPRPKEEQRRSARRAVEARGEAERDRRALAEEAEAPRRTPVVLVTDPRVLAEVDAALGGFSGVVLGTNATQTAEMMDSPRWRVVADTLRRDLEAMRREDTRSGVGMRFAHRLFDARWLHSPKTHFELVGLVNRMDRQPFAPETCGEIRLIYRLAYRTRRGAQEVASRLPMTVNVVHHQLGDCGEVAGRWMVGDEAVSSSALAPVLTAFTDAARGRAKSVEVNLQAVRWPSTVRPDLAGHAEYILRVFAVVGETVRPAKLENTPDVPRLRRNGRLRAELLRWLQTPETLAAIDEGTAVLPERFAAERVISVTPRGLARGANRPFASLFEPSELEAASLSGLRHASTPAALLRRLDGMACNGCHQTRSVAGFHLVGEEADPQEKVDAVAVAASPHLGGEVRRRGEVIERFAQGHAVDFSRPLSDAERAQGQYGSHCGLGDPGFAAYGCAEGLVCTRVDEAEMGVCLPAKPGAGDPCEVGRVGFDRDPHRDRVRGVEARACPWDAACFSSFGGFPAGMCARLSCLTTGEGEGCGAIPILSDFNGCVARHEPFRDCIVEHADPAGLRACDADHPCRDDYICARAQSDEGVCIPPYFLFQLRVDGHVL